jgi:hypothetical protein
MADRVYTAAKSPAVNGAVLIMLAIYLAAVVYQGNVGDFAKALWADFSGQQPGGGKTQRPAFWQWALAVLVLYALAQYPETEHLFGPLLGIVIVAMMIQLAVKQPGVFQTLNDSVKALFGGT